MIETVKLREKRYDQLRRITKLQCTWISQPNAKQRMARAGRVQNGNYYALYSKARFESLRAIGVPEMLRSNLQEVCLDIKAQAFKPPIRQFLAQSIDPPSPTAVDASVMILQALQALMDDEELTPLERLLASLAIHPSLGKMVVLGVIFRCVDPLMVLGAALDERSIFMAAAELSNEAQEAHRQFLEGTSSDHIIFINTFRQLRQLRQKYGDQPMYNFARENFLHTGGFKTIYQTVQQIKEVLIEAGLISYTAESERLDGLLGHPSLNQNAKNVNLIKALTLTGVHPNLAVSKGVNFRTQGERTVLMRPS